MPRMPCILYSNMIKYLEDLPCLSHCRMNRPDIATTGRCFIEWRVRAGSASRGECREVAGTFVSVVGITSEWRAGGRGVLRSGASACVSQRASYKFQRGVAE